MKRRYGFSTKAIHCGDSPDPATGAVVPPLSVSTTFALASVGKPLAGYDYARTGNPTRCALEEKIAALEGGEFGLCYASGMAAVHAALLPLRTGDTIAAEENIYGGTYRILTRLMPRYGIRTLFLDCTDSSALKAALKEKPRILWLESPTNPLLKIIDIKSCAQLARKAGILTVVDNTLASPYLQRPLELGADVVVHSATKYIGGHSDALGGALVTNDSRLYKELRFFQNAMGAVPGALENFLILRGSKTLELRMERACSNAESIAEFLDGRPEVRKVWYPGLKGSPGREIASAQMRRFGAIVTFELGGTETDIQRFLKALKLFPLAVSLGAVESLMDHPWTMSHGCVPAEEKMSQGITPGLLRISTGVESLEDLLYDLKSGFAAMGRKSRKG
jgi:cystathionine gamma-lyase